MTDLIFSTPWWLIAALVVLALLLFVYFNNRQRSILRNPGVAVLLATALLAAVSYFVETDHEAVDNGSRAVIKAVGTRDWAKFESLWHPQADFLVVSGPKKITELAKAGAESQNLSEVTMFSMDSIVQDAFGFRVEFTLISKQGANVEMPARSRWRLEWKKDGKVWKIHRAELLEPAFELKKLVPRMPTILGK